jgi:hypothetical protein
MKPKSGWRPWNSPRAGVTAALTPVPGDIATAAELTAIPVVGVNLVAFYGQFSWFHGLQDIPLVMQVVMAASLESIAVYLAYQAHVARKKGDSAFRLRLGAYLAALGIGALNYWHWCGPGWKPDPLAVIFAAASAISPALWGVYSNRESRDALKAQDLIEGHAVRLGPSRWFWHPLRSVMVQSMASWAGENRPAAAIALYEQRHAGRAARKAERSYAQKASRDTGVTAVPGVTAEKPSPVPASRNRETASGVVPGRAARTTGLVAASAHEAEVVLRLVTAGQPFPSVRKLAAADFGGSIRASQRVLKLAAARMNGGGHDHAGHA